MNLVKLQAELRGLQSKLLWLENEIEGMKSRESEEYKEIYEKSTSLAKRHIIRHQGLKKAGQEVKEGYIGCLSYLSLIEKGISKHKLLFLTRLALGINRKYTATDVMEYGLKFGKKNLGDTLYDLKKWKYSLLLDSLILVNLGEEKREGLSFVADMAYLLDISQEELKLVSKVAKAVLEQNFDLLKKIEIKEKDIKFQGMFTHHIPEEWLLANRIYCLELKKVTELTGGLKQSSYVRKGRRNTIRYVDKSGYTREEKFVTPVSGMLFYTEYSKKIPSTSYKNKFYVYITSYFDDPAEVKKWVEKKHSVSS